MAFKVKDVLINIGAEGAPPGEDAGEFGCRVTSLPRCPCCGVCGDMGGCGCTHTPTIYMPPGMFQCIVTPPHHWPTLLLYMQHLHGGDATRAAEQLEALKKQLRDALTEIETEERRLREKAQPETREQIEKLQGKLKEANEELERRKSRLRPQTRSRRKR